MDRKSADGSDARLMDVNNLRYEEPNELALVESGSVFKKNNADQQAYSSGSGTEIVVTLQSSTDFVYGPNSYLRFDIQATGLTGSVGDLIGFLNSPATALFERFLLEDKSGAEVERVENINKAVRNCLPWKYPEEYRGSVEMAGQSPYKNAAVSFGAIPAPPLGGVTYDADIVNFAVNSSVSPALGNNLRVCIPLWYFSGLFHEETLLPPQLISGMRFRLTLAPALEALSIIGTVDGVLPAPGGTIAYAINDPVIMMDTYSLALSVQKNIMEQSQSQMGLPYTYETLYYQSGNASTNTAYTQQVNKAVARAQKMWTITQQTDNPDNILADSLGTSPLAYFQYQSRIGDWYAPQQTLQVGIDGATAAQVQRNCAELYANNLQCSSQDVCGMCMPSGLADPYRPVSWSLQDFRSELGYGVSPQNNGNGVLVQTLNQSPHIGNSGIAINNSRTAEVRLRYSDDQNTVTKSVLTWLQYVKVASVYPSRTVIKQ